jgi:predicted P-loop ATPase
VALVASVLEKDVVNQTVLILQGRQGCGKSTFLLGLAPDKLNEYVFSGNLNPNNKDSIIQLAETIICQLDELETLTKYKEGALKELITKSEIRVRRPYARFHDKLTRYASLCGSINQGTMLHDPTGSRRFLIHRVKDINYQHNIDIDKVYSQALHLYNEGFKYWFDGKGIQRINAHNKQFETQSVEEELLLEHYEKADKGDPNASKYTATQILEKLHKGNLPSNSHGASIRLGQALSKHDFEYTRSKGSTYWWVTSKDTFEGHFMQDG